MKLYLMARCFASSMALAPILASGQQFALRDNTTVVFYGDSITAQHLYARFTEEFVLTRYPTLHITSLTQAFPETPRTVDTLAPWWNVSSATLRHSILQ